MKDHFSGDQNEQDLMRMGLGLASNGITQVQFSSSQHFYDMKASTVYSPLSKCTQSVPDGYELVFMHSSVYQNK